MREQALISIPRESSLSPEVNVRFPFRGAYHYCNIYIDSSPIPGYLFAILADDGLIGEFGDDVTVKTDFETSLPKKDDYPELVELRRSIFNVVKTTPQFWQAKNRSRLIKKTK